MRLEGGYKTQTVIQLANILAAFNRRQISFRAFRLYFAALAAVAAREAASRASSTRKRTANRFEISELARLCDCLPAVVRKELRSLERAGLLLYAESLISFTTSSLPCNEETSLALAGGRSPRRPVPIPRAALRFIATCSSAALCKTTLAYCVRGLTLTRAGEVRGKGTAKASWISETFGISLRAVRLARAELIASGFISRDVASKQWKLNRDGAYFAVNMSFGARGGVPKAQSNLAPPAAQNCTLIAPLYKDRKTPIGLKDQRTHRGEESGSRKASREPNLKDVQVNDLRSVARMTVLHRHAAAAELVPNTEAGKLAVLAAAVHAVRIGRANPPGLFMSILRKGTWHFVTQADEEHARKALLRVAASTGRRRHRACDGEYHEGAELESVAAVLGRVNTQLTAPARQLDLNPGLCLSAKTNRH